MLMEGVVAARLKLKRLRGLGLGGSRTDMVRWLKILGMALLSGGTLAAGPVREAPAATSSTLDILPDDAAGTDANTVDLGSVKPIARPDREGGKPLPGGNPLWAVPLSVLTATRERPIFSVSRRPPPRAVVAPPVTQVSAPPPPKAAELERPSLTLVGAVVGESDAIAVFLDLTDQRVVRLRQGESHAGWVLNSVLPREVSLKRADRTETFELQRPDGSAGTPGAPAASGFVVPAAGGGDTSYAPFVPRSAPKNGKSDGL